MLSGANICAFLKKKKKSLSSCTCLLSLCRENGEKCAMGLDAAKGKQDFWGTGASLLQGHAEGNEHAQS